MSRNPFKDSTKKTQRAARNGPLDLAVVEQVHDDAGHTVLVRILTPQTKGPGSGTPIVAPVTVPQHGDVALPQKGALVVVARLKGRRPIVIGTLYNKNNPVGSYVAGSRIIGNDSGATITITEEGSIELEAAPGESVVIDGRSVEETISNPLSVPHAEWTTANTQNEIWRVELEPDETLKVYRLEVKFKGGGTDANFYIDIYDVDDAIVIAQTSDVAQGSPIGTSGKGHTVIARLTNDTASDQVASISSKISIIRDT